MSGFNSDPTPQFGKAEYVGTAGNDHCQFCHQPISGTYYRVNKAMACANCAQDAQKLNVKPTHAAYMRASMFGIGAAVLGMALYATFEIVTGIVIGYASLAVGWMIGKAMLKGSDGVGGRRFQITAAVLTYLAVSMAAIPVGFHFANKHRQEMAQTTRGHSASPEELADEQRQLEQDAGGRPSMPAPTEQPNPSGSAEAQQPKAPRQTNPVRALGFLFVLGIGSPFLELMDNFVSGAIGIVILLVGIRIAWRMTEGTRIDVFGPFDSSKQST